MPTATTMNQNNAIIFIICLHLEIMLTINLYLIMHLCNLFIIYFHQ